MAFQPSGLEEEKIQVQFKFFCFKKVKIKNSEFKELNLSHRKNHPFWKGKCLASSCSSSAVLELLWFGSLVCFELFHFFLSEFFQWLFCFLMHFFLFWTHGVTRRVPSQIQGGMERRTLSFPFFVAAPCVSGHYKSESMNRHDHTTQFLLCLPLAEPDFFIIFLLLLFCLFHCWFYLSPLSLFLGESS